MTAGDYFDVCVLLCILIGTFWGLMRGFVQALSIVLATGIGVFAARNLTDNVLGIFGLSRDGLMPHIVGFVLFAAASMAVYEVMNLANRIIQRRNLSAWNHVLGLVLGFVLSLILCWTAAWGMSLFPKPCAVVTHSRSAKYLVLLAEFGKSTVAAHDVYKVQTGGDFQSREEGETFFQRPDNPRFYDDFIQRVETVEDEDGVLGTEPDSNSHVREILDEIDAKISEAVLPEER